MDTLKKIIHPKDSSSSSHQQPQPTESTTREPFPYELQQEERAHQQQNIDPNHPTPRAGHHHPRQPVGATGLPPNHKPREQFTPTTQQQEGGGGAAGGPGEDMITLGKQVAESGNNFPGTNPHPAHSALGNQSMTGEKGAVMPGRE